MPPVEVPDDFFRNIDETTAQAVDAMLRCLDESEAAMQLAREQLAHGDTDAALASAFRAGCRHQRFQQAVAGLELLGYDSAVLLSNRKRARERPPDDDVCRATLSRPVDPGK